MYNAFISYSHRKDSDLAPRLERALEKFAKPLFKKRALNIFRDSNDLSASPDLWGKIEEGLDSSEYFIFLGSKQAAQSRWCKKEVEHWKLHKSMDNFLVVLTDGDLVWDESKGDFDWNKTTAIPENLSGAFRNEPLYVDFRGDYSPSELTLENPDFKSKVVLLAATLHNKQVGDMVGEATEQHRKMLLIRNGVIVVLTLLLGFSILKTCEANRQTQIAEKETKRAQDSSKVAVQQRKIAEVETKRAMDSSDVAQEQRRIARDSAIVAKEQRDIAVQERNKAQANSLMFEAIKMSDYDSTLALRLAEVAMNLIPTDSSFKVFAERIYKDNIFYKKFKKPEDQKFYSASPNGETIITKGRKNIMLWRLEGNQLAEINVANTRSDFKFSPNGKLVLSRSLDLQDVKLWDLKGNLITAFIPFETTQKNQRNIVSVNFSPDGAYVLSDFLSSRYSRGLHKSTADTLKLWDLKGNQLGKSIINYGHYKIVNTADGLKILIASNKNEFTLVDKVGNQAKIPILPISDLKNYYLFPTGDKILTYDTNNLKIWNLNGEKIGNTIKTDEILEAVDFSLDGKIIITRSASKKNEDNSTNDVIKLWDLEGNLIGKTNDSYKDSRLTFFPDGSRFLIWGTNYLVPMDLEGNVNRNEWDIRDGIIEQVLLNKESLGFRVLVRQEPYRFICYLDFNGKIISRHKIPGLAKEIHFSEDGNNLIAEGTNGSILLMDLHRAKNSKLIFKSKDKNTLRSAKVSWDKGQILTISCPETKGDPGNGVTCEVQFWDWKGNRLGTFKMNSFLIYLSSLGGPGTINWPGLFLDESNALMVSPRGNEATLINKDSKVIATLPVEKYSGSIFSPNGKYVLTLSEDNKCKLWNINGNLVFETKSFEEFNGFQFSPGNERIVFIQDGDAVVYDFSGNIKAKINISGSSGYVSTFFSPDGNKIGFIDNEKLKIWDLKTGNLSNFITQKKINIGVFSPNSKVFLTYGHKNEINLWTVNSLKIKKSIIVDKEIIDFSFSSDGNNILVVHKDSISLFDLAGNQIIDPWTYDNPKNGFYSPDSQYLFLFSDHTIQLCPSPVSLNDYLKSSNLEPLTQSQKKNYVID